MTMTAKTSRFFNKTSSNDLLKPSSVTSLKKKKEHQPISTLKRKREESGDSFIPKSTTIMECFTKETAIDHSICPSISFPSDTASRNAYRTKEGKMVTPHQWAVYDLTRKIPLGTVTTYKYLCAAVGSGSPRSVGSALRNNPFAPHVPCHRIIASDHYIGGFCGTWGLPDSQARLKISNKKVKTERDDGEDLVLKKITMLAQEGVGFDLNGKLIDPGKTIWKFANDD